MRSTGSVPEINGGCLFSKLVFDLFLKKEQDKTKRGSYLAYPKDKHPPDVVGSRLCDIFFGCEHLHFTFHCARDFLLNKDSKIFRSQ
jgi:hypothetical protein